MRIAITYDIEKREVFQHFGKTEHFLIADVDTKEAAVIDNGGHSHHELIPYLANLGVKTLICGGIGNHAVDALKSYGIDLIPGVSGDIDTVLTKFESGLLVGNQEAIHQCSHH